MVGKTRRQEHEAASHCIHNQEAEDEFSFPLAFPPQPREWCRPFVGREMLLCSIKPFLKHPHRHARRLVSMVILKFIRLTMKIHHCRWLCQLS